MTCGFTCSRRLLRPSAGLRVERPFPGRGAIVVALCVTTRHRIAGPPPCGQSPDAVAQFRITVRAVKIHQSARKHGIHDGDIRQAARRYLIAYVLDDDQPLRQLRLGFDAALIREESP